MEKKNLPEFPAMPEPQKAKIPAYLEVRGGEMLSLLVVGVKFVADGALVVG